MGAETQEVVPVLQAEIVQTPATGEPRHVNGRFAPGNPGGRRMGVRDKITETMRRELAERMASDPKTNPLTFFCDVMTNEGNRMEHRLQAGKLLAGFILPKLFAVQDESDPGELVAERKRVTETLTMYIKGRTDAAD